MHVIGLRMRDCRGVRLAVSGCQSSFELRDDDAFSAIIPSHLKPKQSGILR